MPSQYGVTCAHQGHPYGVWRCTRISSDSWQKCLFRPQRTFKAVISIMLPFMTNVIVLVNLSTSLFFVGAAFTRFQTLRLQKVFPSKLADSLVSYGSCQFPTLGFVVERYRAVENFVTEAFWKIKGIC